ncbi:MAG: hypothetical protein KGJ86_02945 [Chloroflexota bacterium]|nr:hypothetical protein [Chloroflexota bacterium]
MEFQDREYMRMLYTVGKRWARLKVVALPLERQLAHFQRQWLEPFPAGEAVRGEVVGSVWNDGWVWEGAVDAGDEALAEALPDGDAIERAVYWDFSRAADLPESWTPTADSPWREPRASWASER